MKNMILILIGVIAFDGFAINKIVIPKRAVPGSTITASNTNENLDTIASKVNKLIDSLDAKFPRFTDYSSGDSTLVSKRADFDTTTSDTANITRGLKAERAHITSAGIGAETVTISTIDSARIRDIEADTLRAKKIGADSTYSAALRGLRLYSPVADIDSVIGRLKVGGDISAYNVADNCYMYATSSSGTIYVGSSKTGGASFHAGIADAMKIIAAGSYPLVVTHNQLHPIIFGTNDIERVRIHANGNVKIVEACTSSAFVGPLTGNVTGDVVAPTSITIAGGSQLTAYLDTTFYDSLFDGTTYRMRKLARIVRVGDKVTLYQPPMYGVTTAATATTVRGIPSVFWPDSNVAREALINVNFPAVGIILLRKTGVITIHKSDMSYIGSAIGGIGGYIASPEEYFSTSITWSVN